MSDLFAGVLPFVFTAEARSFRAAAQRLGVSPAAVSKAVARLEDELGVKLFFRSTRRVALSPEGAAFLVRCREAVNQVSSGRRMLALAQKDPGGELTVSMPYILGAPLVRRLPQFRQAYPSLRLALRFSDSFSQLLSEGVDVAIRIGNLHDSSLVSRKLLQPRWSTVAAPSYVEAAGIPKTPEDLRQHNCLMFIGPRGTPTPWSFSVKPAAATTPERLHVHGTATFDQGEMLLQAAIAGLGVCQAMDFMTEGLIRRGMLVPLLSEYAAAAPPVHALFLPEQRRAPRVQAFVDFVRDTFNVYRRLHPLA